MRQEAALTHALGSAVCCRSRSCDEDYHGETGRRFQHRNPRRTSATEKPQSFQQPGGAWGWSWTSSAEGTGKMIHKQEREAMQAASFTAGNEPAVGKLQPNRGYKLCGRPTTDYGRQVNFQLLSNICV